MMHLNLVSHEQWADGPAWSVKAVSVHLSDGERHVTVSVPFHIYGQTRVAAMPEAALSGAMVTLNLERWQLYDLATDRPIGLTVTTPQPVSPESMALAERYAREARRLGSAELAAWRVQVAGRAGGQR
jgi:hypothetical protein